MRTMVFVLISLVMPLFTMAQTGGGLDPFAPDLDKKTAPDAEKPDEGKALAPTGSEENAKNLLPNAGFDEVDAETGLPQGWRVVSYGGSEEVSRSREPQAGPHKGPCLKVSSGFPTDSGFVASVKLEPHTKYVFGGSIRTENVETEGDAKGACFEVIVKDGSRAVDACSDSLRGTEGWKRVHGRLDTGAHGGEYSFICLLGAKGKAQGTAWFDAVYLRKVEAGGKDADSPGEGGGNALPEGMGRNLVANSVFMKLDEESNPVGWQFRSFEKDEVPDLVHGVGNAGDKDGNVVFIRTGEEAVRAAYITSVELRPDTEYLFGGWSKTDALFPEGWKKSKDKAGKEKMPKTGASFLLREQAGDREIVAESDFLFGKNPWKMITGRMLTGSAGGKFDLLCAIGDESDAVKGEAWFGGVFIRAAVAPYRRPSLDAPLFHRESLTLDKDQIVHLAAGLTAMVCNFPENEITRRHDFQAWALGLALHLDPRNRSAVVANGLLDKGQRLKPLEKHRDLAALIGSLGTFPPLLLGEEARSDDKILGVFLADLLWRLDPDGGYGPNYVAMRNAGQGADWTSILPPLPKEPGMGVPGSTGQMVAGGDNGHGDVSGENGRVTPPVHSGPKINVGRNLARETGVALTVALTGGPGSRAYVRRVSLGNRNFWWEEKWDKEKDKTVRKKVRFDRMEPTRVVLPDRFASRFSEVWKRDVLGDFKRRFQGWPTGSRVDVKIPGYGSLSGSSAILAVAVGFEGMLRDLDINPRVAMVGTWSDKGELTTHSHLSGMMLCYGSNWSDILLVGPGSKAELEKAVQWGFLEPFLSTHVIEVQSLTEAVAIASGNPPADVEASLEAVKQVLDLKDKMEPGVMAKNPYVLKKLEELKQAHPSHLTPHLLLEVSKRQEPLGREGTLDMLLMLNGWLEQLVERDIEWMSENEGEEALAIFNARMREAKPRMDPVVNKLAIRLDDAMKALKVVIHIRDRETPTAQRRIEGARALVSNYRDAILAEKDAG